jgi:cytidine deaminase
MQILLIPSDYPQTLDEEKRKQPGITEGGVLLTDLNELLPYSFGPEHLEIPRK